MISYVCPSCQQRVYLSDNDYCPQCNRWIDTKKVAKLNTNFPPIKDLQNERKVWALIAGDQKYKVMMLKPYGTGLWDFIVEYRTFNNKQHFGNNHYSMGGEQFCKMHHPI